MRFFFNPIGYSVSRDGFEKTKRKINRLFVIEWSNKEYTYNANNVMIWDLDIERSTTIITLIILE